MTTDAAPTASLFHFCAARLTYLHVNSPQLEQNKGPWDYKQLGRQYQDFGNFNFDATGAAAGFGEQYLLRAAGYAQMKAGTSKPEWGTYLGRYPHGDVPHDQEEIIAGIEYYKNYKKSGCPTR